MTQVNRTAIAVTFLANDEDARRVTLSWPLVDPDLHSEQMRAAWSRTSGVARSKLERLAEVLLRHEICKADRTIDPEAARVIQHVAAETLRTSKRAKR